MRFACDLQAFCKHLACDDGDEKNEEEKMRHSKDVECVEF